MAHVPAAKTLRESRRHISVTGGTALKLLLKGKLEGNYKCPNKTNYVPIYFPNKFIFYIFNWGVIFLNLYFITQLKKVRSWKKVTIYPKFH